MTLMTAHAAAIAHLTAEVERLTRENELLTAQAVVDAGRIRRLLALIKEIPSWIGGEWADKIRKLIAGQP